MTIIMILVVLTTARVTMYSMRLCCRRRRGGARDGRSRRRADLRDYPDHAGLDLLDTSGILLLHRLRERGELCLMLC